MVATCVTSAEVLTFAFDILMYIKNCLGLEVAHLVENLNVKFTEFVMCLILDLN
jgi:hypothetical protein